MTPTARKAAPAPWRSGFCGLNNPATSHRLCRGAYDDDHPCICPCHQPAILHIPEDPMPSEVVNLAGEVILTVPDQPTATDLPTAVIETALAAEVMSQHALARDVAKIDWQDAVRMLDQIRHTTDLIASVRDALTLHVYLTGEHGDQEVDGIKGVVRIARGRERKQWRVEDTARAVVDAKMEALEGEEPDPLEVVDWLLEVLHVDYARVTPMRAAGLDPKEFCTDLPGKISVTLPPR